MIFIFDLDGTLIDSSDRMYNLFCELIPECQLTKCEYWNYKRNKISHQILLDKLYPQHSFEDFNSVWMNKIESEYYLGMDYNYLDTKDVLEVLKGSGNCLLLLTARQSKDGLMNELNRLGLLEFFDNVLTAEGKRSKEDVLLEYASHNACILDENNCFISDMGKDIQLAKKYGYRTVAISHGFMSREKLEEYHPDVLIDELSELLYLPHTTV